MPEPHDSKLVNAVDLLLETAVEKGYYYAHVDDLSTSFKGVSNWLRGAIETFQVAIELCQNRDTAINITMAFALDQESKLTETDFTSLADLENAFDHSITGTPPELYLFRPNIKEQPLFQQLSSIEELPILFPYVKWYYQVVIDDWGDPHRTVWMVLASE